MPDTNAATKQKGGSAKLFTDEEQAALRDRAAEVKRDRSRATKKAKGDGEQDIRAKIAELPEEERALAERVHELVRAAAPELEPRTWYGMPAYARDGKIVCFFQPASKFKARYATFGFDEAANLDEGTMWPTSYAITELTPADERRLTELLKQAMG